MNLSRISDQNLLSETLKLVKSEREILSQILHHLREIERRRLFSLERFPSLFEYAVKILGYSEDQAYRRIQAMRLLKELPEIEQKINQGTLSLTHLGMAQSLFKRQEKSGEGYFTKERKMELLNKLERTSKREAERITLAATTTPPMPFEKIRHISGTEVEFRFTAKEEVLKKIENLKGLLAHKNPNIPLGELLDQLCDLGLKKWDKSRKGGDEDSHAVTPQPPDQSSSKQAPLKGTFCTTTKQLKPASAPARVKSLKTQIWVRDKGKCQICQSRYALQLDHIWPRGMGGRDEITNLRLLCRSCNQRQAIRLFGQKKMDRYLG